MAGNAPWLPLRAVMALLIAVFLAPALDAAVCADELPVVAEHVADQSHPESSEDQGGADHAICGHGHCHHGNAARLDSTAEPLMPMSVGERPPFLHHGLASSAAEGLKRPPRA